MTYVPIIPHIPGSGEGAEATKPLWLKLEEGETYLRAYSGSRLQARSKIMVLIGLLVLGLGFGVFFFLRASSGGASIELPGRSWLVLSVLVINLIAVIAIMAAKRAGVSAYLTTKMLIVRGPQGFAGVKLADITAIKHDDGKLTVYSKHQHEPVARLAVADLEKATAELAAYCHKAGAKLQQ